MDQSSDIEEVFIDCGGPDDVECILLDDSDEDVKEAEVKVDEKHSENSHEDIKSNNKVKDEPPTNKQKRKKSSTKKPQNVQKKIKAESPEIDLPKKSLKIKLNLKDIKNENSITTNEDSSISIEFHCALCFNKYPTKDKLNVHMDVHRGKSHVCPICKKNMSTEGNLTKHIKRHSSTNPRQYLKTPQQMVLLKAGKPIYTCPICGKDVKKRYRLQRHMVVHSTMKNYICQVCNKGFANEVRLQNHAQIHTDNYKCKMCGKILASNYSLKKHKELYCKMNDEIEAKVRKTAKRIRMKCKKCTKTFSKQWKLNYHMLGVHGISISK